MYMWRRVEHPALWVYRCGINHIIYGCFRPFLGRHVSDMPCRKCIILFVDVTSFNDIVTSYVISQHRMCIGHMAINIKRAANTSEGGVSSVSLLDLTLSPETLVWLVSRVGRNASSTSSGRSLLPSTVIIVC